MKIITAIILLSIILSLNAEILYGREKKSLIFGKKFRTPVVSIPAMPEGEDKLSCDPGNYSRKIKVDNRNRYYELHVPPSYDKSIPVPLVLVFHGGGGDPGTIRYESGMDRISDKECFIVAYPAGTNKRLLLKNRLLLWNDGRPFKDGTYSDVDDIAFVKALLDDIENMFNIDVMRVYSCGYSNGAQFTYCLAKLLSGRIAAIAAVAGQRSVNDIFYPPPRPFSIMQFAGMQDTIGPYSGGEPSIDAKLKTTLDPVEQTVRTWAEFNNCPLKPEIKRTGNAIVKCYGPCEDGAEVILWTLEDGGHTWPGGRIVPSAERMGLGNINCDISASVLMWDFFKKHPMPAQ